MISEGSCDTKDRSNTENSALITGRSYLLKYIQTENILYYNSISQYYSFYCIFDQINAAFVRLVKKKTLTLNVVHNNVTSWNIL